MSAIEGLIARAEEAARQEADATKRQREDALCALLSRVEDTLGDVWQELKPYHTVFPGAHPYLQIDHPDFGAFVIAEYCCGHCRDLGVWQDSYRDCRPQVALDSADLSPFGVFLAARRAEISAERDRERADQIEQLTRKIRSPRQVASRQHARAYAAEAYRALMELAPERVAEWQAMLAACEDAITTEEDLLRRRAAAAEEYSVAYRSWALARNAAFAETDRRFEQIQRRLDTPFHLWELEYAVVARDGDEPYLETRTAHILSNLPNVNGEYPVVFYGQVINTSFSHVVAIRDLGAVRPTEQHAVACSRHVSADRILYWAPGQPEPDTSGIVVPVPPAPDVPEVLAGRQEPEFLRARVEAELSQSWEGDHLNE